MVLSMLMNDRITLVKKDGSRFEGIQANVQPTLILTTDTHLQIEEGDHFERRLPNGLVESYEVLEAGFMIAPPPIGAHYQSKVRKTTARPARINSPSTVYNVTGPNARINFHSRDSSTNIVNVESSTLFLKMREAVVSIEDAESRERLIAAIGEMESSVGGPTFIERYKEFMGTAANHMTVFAPFFPALTQLLS